MADSRSLIGGSCGLEDALLQAESLLLTASLCMYRAASPGDGFLGLPIC